MRNNIKGVLTAIVTPFDAEGELNLPGLTRQVARQLDAGNGIFCGGTNGEFFVLNEAEKIAVTRTCVETVAGRAPVVAHIGEISTRDTIRLGKQIAALGVDAVSVITPYFVPLKQSELIAHYTAVADALTVPVFLYNIPARTGNTLEPATVRALAEHPNISGIKDSAGSDESLRGFLNAVSDIDGFDVLNGPDSLIHQASSRDVQPVFPGWQTWRQRRSTPSGHALTRVMLKVPGRRRSASPDCAPSCTAWRFPLPLLKRPCKSWARMSERVAMPWRLASSSANRFAR